MTDPTTSSPAGPGQNDEGVLHWRMLATHVPPGGSLGGVVRYTTELLAALARREDIRLDVVATAAAVATLTDVTGGRASVSTAPAVPGALLPFAERYLRSAARPGRPAPDIVHGVKHLVPRRSSALRVLTVHDTVLLDRPGDSPPLKRALLPRLYRASISEADLLLCVSDATRQALGRHDPTAASRSAVTPLATAGSLLASQPRALPALVGRRFILVVGDAGVRKNVGAIVDAWPAVRRAVPDVVLAIAGPPAWGRTDRGAAYASLVKQGALLALGRIDDAELRWAYEHSAVVACPSLMEGFGLPVAEALDLGASVVLSQDQAQREVAAGRELAVVAAHDIEGWQNALVAALQRHDPRRNGAVQPVRCWDDVATDTVAAARSALARRVAPAG